MVEFFGDGSVESQLKMFATASAIVGPHGAGLSNMVVSPLRTPVLEIAATGCPYCYTHLAIKVCFVFPTMNGFEKPGQRSWYSLALIAEKYMRYFWVGIGVEKAC